MFDAWHPECCHLKLSFWPWFLPGLKPFWSIPEIRFRFGFISVIYQIITGITSGFGSSNLLKLGFNMTLMVVNGQWVWFWDRLRNNRWCTFVERNQMWFIALIDYVTFLEFLSCSSLFKLNIITVLNGLNRIRRWHYKKLTTAN